MGRSKDKRKPEGENPNADLSLIHRRSKRAKQSDRAGDTSGSVSHPLLSQLYPCIQTLRDYVLARLPASSRLRRKKIALVGRQSGILKESVPEVELAVAHLLDTTLVACSVLPETPQDDRWEKWNSFSQKGDESYVTLSDNYAGACFSQTEIVDFAIWLLFSRVKIAERPRNLICDGFRRDASRKPHSNPIAAQGQIPGLFAIYQNNNVQALKQDPWPKLLLLLGQSGERIMIDLLLDCSIFAQVEAGRGNYQQLSGFPVSDLDYGLGQSTGAVLVSSVIDGSSLKERARSPSEITFVRSRMLYARAALNARGVVHFGLRHIHVLNRFPLKRTEHRNDTLDSRKYEEATIRMMMYMFPRQFGLHNVFTSQVDYSQTAQKFQDYTLREEEIARKFCVASSGTQQFKAHVPKRLRGLPQHLVESLQVLHARCSYSELLEHYCPAQVRSRHPTRMSQGAQKQSKPRKKFRQPAQHAAQLPQYSSLVDLATPTAGVSAFCQAVLAKTIPNDFFGGDSVQKHNRNAFCKRIDHFIRMRRFEQLSLHEVIQDLKISEIDWLTPPNLKAQKCSRPETQKRTEIFLEFLYYVVDSIVIPLIRSNFYVTESSVHKYRLFFFRHDTWRYVAEPAMTALKTAMFEEVRLDDARQILDSRRLGFSQVRLLPKGVTMRPIMNLRRRTMLKGSKKLLGPSINTILGPVASMLKLEKTVHPERLGSAMFSVGDIYKRIKEFKDGLGAIHGRFYFAKVDVQGAFDSIPHQAMIDLMTSMPRESEYKLVKHVEVKSNDMAKTKGTTGKPLKKWHSLAKAPGDRTSFKDMLELQIAQTRRNTVFVESVVTKSFQTRALMTMMTTHIQQNFVKIGKKFYRQKNGIPQGSVLSSTLCSYFYADLERTQLSFLEGPDCLLLRLIDDFLLITTDQSKAALFVEIMHCGVPFYGVTVNPDKTLVNFAMATASQSAVPRLPHGVTQFPYCGTLIDTTTLAMTKNREPASPRSAVVFDSLTVERGRRPGQNFCRKVLNAFKIQSHLMFYDAAHNSTPQVLRNVHAAFLETAEKAWAYARCLPRRQRPRARLVIAAIRDLVDMAFCLLAKSESRAARYPGYKCEVTKPQVAWLAAVAFRRVLGRKQAGYGEVIAWLDQEVRALGMQKRVDLGALRRVVGEI